MSTHNPFFDPTLKKRHLADKIFKFVALSALLVAVSFLVIFFTDIISKGLPSYKQAYVNLPVTYNKDTIADSSYAIDEEHYELVSRAWYRDMPSYATAHPEVMNKIIKEWVLADDEVDQYLKGHAHTLTDEQKVLVDKMIKEGSVKLQFNSIFFTTGDSKIPENSGFLSSVVGSILTIFICIAFAFPIGVMSAIYLEEFAKQGKVSTFLEININNLAAVPSILFGLLGLAIFINLFGMPRSSALVGGLTLGLMTLPVIIVAGRTALRSVPASIRQAAYGLGLTKWQVVKDHVLPLGMPGILTGSIIGIARAMGETAPLIIVGMIAFIPDIPSSFTQASTVMPAQIFTWAGMPEGAYVERVSGAIIILLGVLLTMNALAIYFRKKYEIKW
ncbi:MAG: phosphate ABC transporter permease PstA [Epsilonproteobacteria bacterium]|nr:phosphate ABC transporter permease PstA [Campylobacterota bacterium]